MSGFTKFENSRTFPMSNSEKLKNKFALSICIATLNRADFLPATLDSIIPQLGDNVELVIVDGNSKDRTKEVVEEYQKFSKNIFYYREATNSGVDQDYEKAVSYARGEFCWLMTDDDLIKGDAVQKVLKTLSPEIDLVVVNSEVKDKSLNSILEVKRLNLPTDKHFNAQSLAAFFTEFTNYMSFIGCIIIRRSQWMKRQRTPYFGTLFIHVGVVFQNPPLEKIYVIAEPLMTIRYGNAMWSPRGFEIWLFKWPQLIWSFSSFSETNMMKIVPKEPARNLKLLFYYRALGGFKRADYFKFLSQFEKSPYKVCAFLLSVFPGKLANLISIIYFTSIKRSHTEARMKVYDLLNCKNGEYLRGFFKSYIK